MILKPIHSSLFFNIEDLRDSKILINHFPIIIFKGINII